MASVLCALQDAAVFSFFSLLVVSSEWEKMGKQGDS